MITSNLIDKIYLFGAIDRGDLVSTCVGIIVSGSRNFAFLQQFSLKAGTGRRRSPLTANSHPVVSITTL